MVDNRVRYFYRVARELAAWTLKKFDCCKNIGMKMTNLRVQQKDT